MGCWFVSSSEKNLHLGSEKRGSVFFSPKTPSNLKEEVRNINACRKHEAEHQLQPI